MKKGILGLDIGGANTKGCFLKVDHGEVMEINGCSICYEVWENPGGVRDVLCKFKDLYESNSANVTDEIGIAVTITAELCDVFRSKAEGVTFILNLVEEVFDGFPLYIWTSKGIFVSPAEIKKQPLLAAATNWLASAEALCQSPMLEDKTVIFADMGSTTTDLIPISKGKVIVKGKTDTERLVSGELVYAGSLRTSIPAITDFFYLDGVRCRTLNESCIINADVYRILGLIEEKDYLFPTPDGGSRDVEGCARRLARLGAADLEEIGMEKIYLLARYLQDKHVQLVVDAIQQIISRREVPSPQYVITTGLGSFILEEAARRISCPAIPWWDVIPGAQPEQITTAYSVAWLLSGNLTKTDRKNAVSRKQT